MAKKALRALPIRYPEWLFPLTRLIKVAIFVSLPAGTVLSIFLINDRITVGDALSGFGIIFVLTFILVRPYVSDLTALTHYVKHLALDRKERTAPALSFLSNVEELSKSVGYLQTSWQARNLELEATLTESRIMFDTLPDSIIMLDSTMRIVRTNRMANTALRYNFHERRLEDIFHDETLLEAAKEVVLGGKNRRVLELHLTEKSPRHYIVSIERFPIASSADLAAIMVLHDVTESKRNEQMFVDFVANASHEIRTPLTSLVGFIETLKTSAKDDPQASEKFLGIMEEQADRMSRLVEDLLSLSKIERNVHTAPTEQVNMEEVCQNAIAHLAWIAEDRKLTLHYEAKGTIPSIIGDMSQLMQVCANLLSNAIKYSNEGQNIYITLRCTKKIPFDAKLGDGVKEALCLCVQDEGEGIAAEHLSRLTERFYRVDTARSRKEGGTGLGLAIVKHILNRHRSGLVIQSTVGEGSTFCVYFPLHNSGI
jgi:two-component system phosphate regulon sensor histidine kinase PhoR